MTARKIDGQGQVTVVDSDVDDPTEDALVPRSTAQRIALVMRDIGNVAKSDRNTQQNFNYRSAERVVAAARDAMIEHGLLCLPTKVAKSMENYETMTAKGMQRVARRATLTITYTFMSADDASDVIDTEIVSEALDYGGDKAVSQALTAAHKAILLQSFHIGDNETDQDAGGRPGDEEPPVYADEQWHVELRDRIALLSVAQQDALKAAWRRSWGSPRDGTVPEAAVQEVASFVLAIEALGVNTQ